MEDVQGTLGGFRGVRAELLVALKKAQSLTAQELGARFGLTANAFRRHLKALEEDGLVQYRREVRGVGGPVFAYSLTAAGEALFPRSYAAVLTAALEALRTTEHGSEAVTRVLEAEWTEMVDEAGPLLDSLPLEERLSLVAELLTSKGYMAEVQVAAPGAAGTGTLCIHNCAVREIAERIPEACAVEARMMERMIGAPLVRGAHRLDGCVRCEYGVRGDHPFAVNTEQA
jgi:DeoR family transcriptional regulator, suf operon transcriptional repressor